MDDQAPPPKPERTTDNVQPGSSVETHQLQCRALIIPMPLVLLIEARTINIKEAYFLAYVDALVHAKGQGCWASYRYLADRIQVKSEQHVRRMVRRLIKLKLLKKKRKNGMRILEATWSRQAES